MLSRVPSRGGRLPRLLALLLILLLYITATLPAVQPAGAQSGGGSKIANIPDNPYGVNVFLHKEVEAWKIEETLRMVAAANIKWIKQEFPWNEIEFRKGYFQDDKWNKSSWEKFDNIVNLAGKYGLTIIARVDHPPDWAKAPAGGDSPIKDNADLADFTNALLDHYGDKIKYVQLWNEPNLSAEWVPGKAVDPSAYAAMLKAVYPTVKDAHPKAIVLSAPMAMTLEGPEKRGNMNDLDYWNKLYDAGVKGSFDIASANGYGLDQPPDAPPDPQVLNFRRAELLRDIMVKHGDSARPIWFDEYGWNASPESLSEEEKNYWRHVTLAQQAQWTVEGVRYARRNWPWAGVISVWYFRQVGDIPPDKAEYYFQMVDPEFVPQPVYNSVKVDAGTRYPGPAASPLPTAVNLPPTPTKASDQPTPTPTSPVPTGTPQTSPTTSAATPHPPPHHSHHPPP
ncbi:MAG: cellulase family glycosylhydrolase, partial [Chloroflexia bacterium]